MKFPSSSLPPRTPRMSLKPVEPSQTGIAWIPLAGGAGGGLRGGVQKGRWAEGILNHWIQEDVHRASFTLPERHLAHQCWDPCPDCRVRISVAPGLPKKLPTLRTTWETVSPTWTWPQVLVSAALMLCHLQPAPLWPLSPGSSLTRPS